jgi:WD40 repeat protein
MKTKSWLPATCFTAGKLIVPGSPPSRCNSATSSLSPSATSETSNSSLESNLSLQTLPSVPSLQKISPENSSNITVTHIPFSKITPNSSSGSPITCLGVNNNNHLLYVACGHEIYVYERATCNHLDTFNDQDSSSGSVKSIMFSGGKIFTAHQDCKIRVSQLTVNKRHKLLTVLPTVNDRLRHFILPNSYTTVRRHKKKLWIEHADAVTALAVNNGLVYSVSWDKSLKIWRASDLRCLESVKAHADAVNAVVVSPHGTVYTGSADRTIRVWAKPNGEKKHSLISTLEKHKSSINALAINDDGSVLFSGACDRSILVWEREDSANHMVVTGALRGHNKAILCLVYVNGHDLLISGSADRTVRIWQRGGDGKFSCLGVLEGHTKPVKSLLAMAVSEEKNESGNNGVVSVYSGSLDGEIKVWQVSVSKPAGWLVV